MYNRVGGPTKFAWLGWENLMQKDELNKPQTQTTEPKEVKNKILSRIQQQVDRKEGEEAMTYLKYDVHTKVDQYSKGCVPTVPES